MKLLDDSANPDIDCLNKMLRYSNKMMSLQNALLILSLLVSAAADSPPRSLLLPHDASALLAFKSKADLSDKLRFSRNTSLAFCNWQGVQCVQARVVRFVLEGLGLGGVLGPDTLTRLDQLRVLSLQNNSLTGPIPDLSGLLNLKTLFLDHNSFSGSIPPSILTLHRLRTLDLSFNNLTGAIPPSLKNLDRLYFFRLDSNRLNGSIPPLNQSSLEVFNVSRNNLTGAVPVTPTLLRFGLSSFSWNPGLCGEIIKKECTPRVPFFGPSALPPPPRRGAALGQNEQLQKGVDLTEPRQNNYKKRAVILGFSSGVLILISSIVCFAVAVKKRRNQKVAELSRQMISSDSAATDVAAAVMRIEEENELEEKVKKMQGIQLAKSGSLVFCAGEVQVYTLDQLMRASAELLGKGSIGTTYKAVLDNRLIVCVKRLDAAKLAGTSKEAFERHMESVGGLRHPNLVPLRAYFQAKEERLLIYDYQPNGSLLSLIHGSKSTRAKPLHWTSCLKIAEDVAQGLAYIHQAWRLVHGNLKSSNVLLGSDFEACLTDYCLAALTTSSSDQQVNAGTYTAPEARKSISKSTSKSDVYSFGVLVLELLTGKPPSQHPYLMPDDLMNWVRSSREDDGGDDHRLGMLLEVAVACSATSPEQRPTMWQVLKMIQEIKDAEGGEYDNLPLQEE
ncbi:probable inactive receptor kinase At5g67200 [Diospyros lotus]|uniref:probable inactive receptor kinase At5g67200 n=1 Tax=Diospyros lotus TaxID=55363 RepID=UPI00224D60B0|nr:probable inactive receptor kinase At5g67200 [Diospyros lotus]